MTYIDGFVAAVPTDKKNAYIAHIKEFWPLMQAHGAIGLCENWGDDVPDGEQTSFPMAVKCQEGETVVMSWTIWPDKETREAGWKTMQEDPALTQSMQDMPFDGKRLIFGGFTPVFTDGVAPDSA
ncbi:DUF1428 domain-containing protein [Epibacterium ulvae]|uniref:DUF1428 domain-containing protein n=1 Tax=Epibacterium ulvae TaxID=1156985 RepID=UPI001BFC8E93|nr:DUF1428 domain-containing protein [Epibacterium ulvae]MBT8156071.1 DUF1428 domain-containing protein [Epibacterium ulvae]